MIGVAIIFTYLQEWMPPQGDKHAIIIVVQTMHASLKADANFGVVTNCDP